MASTYRLRRGPLIALIVIVGVLGALLLARGSGRPQVDVYGAVTVPDAYDGTTYAVDGLVCLRATSGDATVREATGSDRTRIGLRPQGAPPAVAFPVPADAVRSLDGAEVPAADSRCSRLLVTARGLGAQQADPVRLSFRYGPLGLLRTTVEVTPPVTLQVTGTGTDPRTAG